MCVYGVPAYNQSQVMVFRRLTDVLSISYLSLKNKDKPMLTRLSAIVCVATFFTGSQPGLIIM